MKRARKSINLSGRWLINRNLGLFERYFGLFLVVIIIPVIIVVTIMYGYSLGIIEKDAEIANIRILNNTMVIIDDRIEEVKNIMTYYINRNSSIMELLITKSSIEDVDTIMLCRDLNQEFSLLHSSRLYISDIYLYIDWFDSIINKSTLYTFQKFYNEVNKYEDLSLGEVKRILKEANTMTFLPTSKINGDKNIIAVTVGLPMYFQRKGTLVINMDADLLFKSVKKDVDIKGKILVLNSNNDLIISVGDEELRNEEIKIICNNIEGEKGKKTLEIFDGNKVQSTWVISPANGWKYIAVIPQKELLMQSRHIKRFSIATLLFFIMVCILISFLMSRKLSNPVKYILEKLKGYWPQSDISNSMGINEFKIIDGSINRLYSDNMKLSDLFNQSRKMIFERIFYRSIMGYSIENDNEEKNLAEYGLNEEMLVLPLLLQCGYDKDFVFRTTENERRYFRERIKDSLLRNDSNGIVVDLENNNFFIMEFTNKNIEKDIKKLAIYIINVLSVYDEELSITIVAGEILKSFKELNTCYRQLKELADRRIFGQKKQVLYLTEHIETNNEFEYLPSNEYKQLENSLTNGDLKYALSVIKGILELCQEYRLNSRSVKLIFTEILNISLQSIKDAGDNPMDIFESTFEYYEKLEKCENYGEANEIYNDIFNRITSYYNNKKESNKDGKFEEILNYLNNNYQRQISLINVAEEVALSVRYISRYFKDKSGENFVDYLNRLRLSKAKELLAKTDMKIGDISERVGYSTPNTFNIVFKKYEGISPGIYREKEKK